MKKGVRAAALAAGVLLALPSATLPAPAQPKLGIASRQPLVLAGRGFHAGELVSVRLAVVGRTPLVRRVEASATGAFRVRFPISLRRCTRFTAQAFGSEGSRARLMPLLLPTCQPSGDE